MEPNDNSIPSHSWDDPLWNNDNIEETLESMDLFSEQHAREDSTFPIHSPPHLTTDSELLGILSGNAIDDMETDTDNDSDADTDDEDNQQLPVMQDNVMPDEEWLSGNPRDSIELPFLKSTGLKEPINFFDALCTTELLDLFKDCSNEYGEKEKRTSVSAQSRSKFWKPTTCEEIKLFFAFIFHMGFVKLNRITDYWKKDIFFNQIVFSQAMTRNRFLLILRMLCVSMGQVTSSYLKIKKYRLF